MGHFIEEIYQVLTALTNYILIAASTCTSLQFGVVSKYRTLQREPGEAHTTSPESLRDTKWLETSFLCFVIQVYAGTLADPTVPSLATVWHEVLWCYPRGASSLVNWRD